MLLEAREVTKRYGGVVAVNDVSVAIAEPGICGLIGPNGAGKTTLFDIICGRVTPNSGSVLVAGRDVTAAPSYARARIGLSRTFQECRILPDETCLDNLLFAAQAKPLTGALRRLATFDGRARRAMREEARRLLRMIRLDAYENAKAGGLSFGQKRLLEIVSTLITKPEIVLFDEPASGINPSLLDDLRQFILDRHAERATLFVIVEHNMDFLMSICDRVVAMHQGQILEDGSPADIRANPRVIEAYLG